MSQGPRQRASTRSGLRLAAAVALTALVAVLGFVYLTERELADLRSVAVATPPQTLMSSCSRYQLLLGTLEQDAHTSLKCAVALQAQGIRGPRYILPAVMVGGSSLLEEAVLGMAAQSSVTPQARVLALEMLSLRLADTRATIPHSDYLTAMRLKALAHQQFRSSEREVRAPALSLLLRLGANATDVSDLLLGLSDEERAPVIEGADWAQAFPRVAERVLRDQLACPGWRVKKASATALARAGIKDPLIEAFISPERNKRKPGAWGLAVLDADMSARYALDVYQTGQWDAREDAVWLLGELTDRACLPVIRTASHDENRGVRQAARIAFDKHRGVRMRDVNR